MSRMKSCLSAAWDAVSKQQLTAAAEKKVWFHEASMLLPLSRVGFSFQNASAAVCELVRESHQKAFMLLKEKSSKGTAKLFTGEPLKSWCVVFLVAPDCF